MFEISRLHFFQLLTEKYDPLTQVASLILLVLIVSFLLKALFKRLHKQFKMERGWQRSFIFAIEKPLIYFLWFVFFLVSLDILSTHFLAFDLLDRACLINVGGVFAFGWFLLRWNSFAMHDLLLRSHRQEISLTPGELDLLSKLGTIVSILITIFLLVDVTGRSMETLLTFGGIGGLALAFASQQFIANLFGGVTIYLTQPFVIDEWVYLPSQNIEGHVEEIGWYMTRIRNFEKRPIYVPNSIFNQSIVITPSRMSHQRIFFKIGLNYIEVKILKQIVEDVNTLLLQHPNIDQDLKPTVFFTNFTSSSLEMEISAYVQSSKASQFASMRQEILLQIASIIDQRGAELAFTNIVNVTGQVDVSKTSS